MNVLEEDVSIMDWSDSPFISRLQVCATVVVVVAVVVDVVVSVVVGEGTADVVVADEQ